MNENLHRVIGIDLGTTYSAVASFNSFTERAEIVFDPLLGDPDGGTTPSVVWFNPDTRSVVVGEVAKRAIASDPEHTVIEVKREMGSSFDGELLTKYQASDVYRSGDPVKIYFCGEWLLPQEISAFVLMRMKAIAEAEIGEIRDAVITVPAYFKEQQKKATEEAALLAGLYPRQLIPEPTAAAICYGVDTADPEPKVFLVYDLGGGTFDVSIIEAREGAVNVISTSGDPRLGGGDFDDAITHWAMEQLGIDPKTDPALARKIKANAEVAKRALSFHEQTELVLPPVAEGESPPPPLQLDRAKFESLIEEIIQKSLSYVEQAVEYAKSDKGLERDSIDAILLVGGSTKIPRVRTLLLDHFKKDESFVRADADPDFVVARGAAIMAYRFAASERFDVSNRPETGLVNPDMDNELLGSGVTLITEHTLGVGVQENLVDPLIKRGTNIPVSVTKADYTNPGPTDNVIVPVYQGEGKFAYDDTLIGSISLGEIEPREQGYHRFEVTFTLDENGLLSVLVKHLNTGREYPAKFDQETAVGGDDALALRRSRLLELYDTNQLVAAIAAPAPAAGEHRIPPPAEVPEPVSPAPSAPPTETAPPSESAPDAESAPAAEPTPPADSVPPTDDGTKTEATPALVEAAVDVPTEFRQIVRRVKKYCLREPSPELSEAFNAFMSALNAGAPADDLEELGDQLADVFDDVHH